MKTMKRRDFLKRTMAASAAMALPHARVLGANDDIRVAVVGMGSFVKIGGRGRAMVENFRKLPGVRVVALCDPDSDHLGYVADQFKKRNETVETYADVRKLLDNPNIDAIGNATPNHWHALITIWACQAGKDVYVVKPASHTLREGRKMVEAARAHNRIVQVGSGPRSSPGLEEAFEYVRQGNLGTLLRARGLNYKPRQSIGKMAKPQPIPKSLDYNLWAGPAPMAPIMREYLHYDWHWVWNTGDGDLGNMGIHYLDACRWALGQTGLPQRVVSIGGRFGYDDAGETPNTQVTLLDYRPTPILFEVRGLPKGKAFQDDRWNRSMDTYRGVKIGFVIECEGGYLAGNVAYDKNGKEIRRFDEKRSPLAANFIEAVRSRKISDLQNDVLDGHLSVSLVHMANISYRIGKASRPGRIREAIEGNHALWEMSERCREHLEANGVDLKETRAVLGPTLTMEPDRERFVGDFSEQANPLLTRKYRKPFVVPEKV